MAEARTIARPYAEAVFRLADAQGKLDRVVGGARQHAGGSLPHARMRAAIGDPNVSPASRSAGSLHRSILCRRWLPAMQRISCACWSRTAPRVPRRDPRPVRGAQERARGRGRGATISTAFELDDAQTRRPGRATRAHDFSRKVKPGSAWTRS